ncbi:type 1 glutamine amidotransferase domain-containing protein [Novosphingobium sp. P6W]|uniref:type 1 glutamine amidotransferase domain-containing protein n=1 Tax=Novosphingobium sp. P6W TaxID=1609758 RepID=UPI0005C2D8A4|nr:type 1 glutamine amidotransferase domain-containing protein [Novosphingobium sp. P6W]AXB79015.1 type 1 glutamine amidotransferase [Novosphingobium sp. P6W]KIS30725.1 glutamine amidotransferase [Novosphingobium sp. P6W]
MSLKGKSIAILIAPRGTEEPEFVQPKQAVEEAGGEVTVISLEGGTAKTNNKDLGPGGEYAIDKTFADVSADAFDGLIIPGGCVGADKLRASSEAVAFVKAFFDQKKPVAVICHGPWLLVEADVVDGRRLTSFSSIRTDVENAGGSWVDEEVVVDEGLVTSRKPDDLPAFCAKLVEEFAEGRHADG